MSRKEPPVHREIYIDHHKYSICYNDWINSGWITTNDDDKVTCGSCHKVMNAMDRKKKKKVKVNVKALLKRKRCRS